MNTTKSLIDIELEKQILGEMLFDEYGLENCLDCLNASDFYLQPHQQIFKTIAKINADGKIIDLVTVRAELQDDLANYIVKLYADTVTTASVKQHCNILLNLSYRRRSIEIAENIKELAAKNDIKSIDTLLNDLKNDTPSASKTEAVPTILGRSLIEIAELKQSGRKIKGYATGIYDLDDLLSGLEKKKLFIIAGRPAMGKSSLALNISHYIAKNNKDENVIFFSLEMTKEDIALKLYSSALNINNEHFKFNMLTTDELLSISKQTSSFSDDMKNFYIEDNMNMNIVDIQRMCRKIKKDSGRKTALIVIDYLQIVKTLNSSNRAVDLGETSRLAVALAKEMNCPVILLSQVNRSCEARQNKRPMLSDLKESGNIEQDADSIIFIYRDEVYNHKSSSVGRAELIVAKQRNGSLGTVSTIFDKKTTTFKNIYR